MPQVPATLDVAVCTYQRPDQVVALVPLLLAQARALEEAQVRVVVVDNDAQGSAREAIAQALPSSDDLVVVVEAEAGLTAARNRALAEAAGRDLLVFIDDDELPHEGWLAALLALYRATGAVGVAGPVLSAFESEPDEWVRASPVWTRTRRPTGTSVPSAGAGNLLLDLGEVRRLGLRFDPRFAFTGGEDTFFTRALAAGGGALLWCDEAVATETVPASRTTRPWVLTRARRNGETWATVRLLDQGGYQRDLLRARFAAKGTARALLYGGRARLARTQGERARYEYLAAGGRGILRAARGLSTQEYGR